MPVDTKHPDYIAHAGEWKLMRDTDRGPVAIADAGQLYLPMPSGFTGQPDGGLGQYGAYKLRARFPDIVSPTIRGMTGLIHRKEAQIEMPPAMEPLFEKCTKEGLTLDAFHMTITQELLRTGRYGVLTDAEPEGSDIPLLSGYTAEAIINWAKDGSFFVLDETHLQRDRFTWSSKPQFRVLELTDNAYSQELFTDNTDTGKPIEVSKRGNGLLDAIPFVVASPNELTVDIGEIPMIGVARASVAIYQLDADYRLQLFMSGQETFVVTGADSAPDVVGASVRLSLPKDATAEYVGPSGKGMEAHKTAIDDAKGDAVAAGAQLFDSKQTGQESGEALRLRYGAQTATLTSIAQTSAALLERSLKNVAIFLNLNPDLVTVKPNLRFVETIMTPQDAESLMKLWMGAAISKETMFDNLQRGDIISEETDFEEEEGKIEQDEIDRAAKADEEMARQRELAKAQDPNADDNVDDPSGGGGFPPKKKPAAPAPAAGA